MESSPLSPLRQPWLGEAGGGKEVAGDRRQGAASGPGERALAWAGQWLWARGWGLRTFRWPPTGT